MARSTIWLALAVACLASSCGPKEKTVATTPEPLYVPKGVYCYDTSTSTSSDTSPLCSTIPGNIGADPALDQTIAYNGIFSSRPTSADTDAQSPFDNLSWQTFVALNWTSGEESEPASEGLQGTGDRVWQTWPRVADVFGNGTVQADCGTIPANLMVFSIASNGNGTPSTNNEEYIQAATAEPLIDVSGNWTIYEHRLNSIEEAYLEAPNGNSSWTLTTLTGQQNLINDGGTVDFPSIDDGGATGAIEIKAAWRVLDPANRTENQKKFFLVPAYLKVAPDLVTGGTSVCAAVDMGLVAMHIIQKNPTTTNALLPEWFWSTFEHVDNVPLAENACDPSDPGDCTWFGNLDCTADPDDSTSYSYYSSNCPSCSVNVPPTASSSGTPYAWNATQPYAQAYLTSTGNAADPTVGTQASRCWKTYSLTSDLNDKWRLKLSEVDSVFQNYFLVGTQWGAALTDPPSEKYPQNAVPSYLSNAVVETYLQTLYDPENPFGTGSCISCHSAATLPVDNTTSANLSFLPDLAQPGLTRVKLGVKKATAAPVPKAKG